MGTTTAEQDTAALTAVHPHRCGDNTDWTRPRNPLCGSPPQVWGQRRERRPWKGCVRFTPTGVGTTFIFVTQHADIPVHPHRCGDNGVQGHHQRAQVRFTPTGVGTTGVADVSSRVTAVHPHGCGDNAAVAIPALSCFGSPPRVWGQRLLLNVIPVSERFTPTGVGTTLGTRNDGGAFPGSPPRVWGQRQCDHAAGGGCRFTPTGVGTTRYQRPLERRPAVHPHGCGDNLMAMSQAKSGHGSPPRVWGQLAAPATTVPSFTVHPHGCGDNCSLVDRQGGGSGSPPRVWGQRPSNVNLRGLNTGSPPRVWGQLLAGLHHNRWHRFTPTGVGTTRWKQ